MYKSDEMREQTVR